jgi:putative nucleotidyltransferase with HDIG domain
MMRTSMEDGAVLAGLRLVVAGAELSGVQGVRDRLAAQGADVRALVGDLEEVARAVAAEPPEAIVADAGDAAALRERLDPLRLDIGPAVIALADANAVRPIVELRRMKARQSELEAVFAAASVARAREAESAEHDTLQRLLQAAGYRDDNTYEHTQRVGLLAAKLARELGLSDRAVALIGRAAPLHDIGKIAIPDSILLKPGRLTEEEFEVVKTHAVLGARVLAGGASDLFAAAESIARSHHERWDGEGYPRGLKGDAIPIAARIVHVADVYDVLVHERPYRESLTPAAAAEEIKRGADTDFDPKVVEVFEKFSLQV